MKEKLVAVLTYHVLPGRLSVKDLWDASNKDGGKAKFKTVEGEELTVEFKGQARVLANSDSEMQRFESCRLSQPVRLQRVLNRTALEMSRYRGISLRPGFLRI
jgi:hypothetical protein